MMVSKSFREENCMTFGEAIEYLKKGDDGAAVTRLDWYGTHAEPVVKLQRPDKHSKMTEPYLYMEKGSDAKCNKKRFPLDLSCESILSDEWVVA